MNHKSLNRRIDDAFARGKPIEEAMKRAWLGVVERARQARTTIVVWRDGRVVHADPSEFNDTTDRAA